MFNQSGLSVMVNQFMVRKPLTGVSSRLKTSLANTSVSSCDSVSSAASSASAASAAARLTTTRPAATSTDRAGAKLSTADRSAANVSRSKSLNPSTKPAPIPRRARPSIGVVQPPNLSAEVKQTSKSASQTSVKHRASVAASCKSSAADKTSSSSSAALASKPPSASAAGRPPAAGRPRMVLKGAGATAAADAKFKQKK